MSYTLQIITPPSSEPVTTADLKAHLRLNTTAEDALLADFISTARTTFETITLRAVLPTVFKQWFTSFREPITLIRGGVTSIASLAYYDQSDSLQTIDPSLWSSDLTGLVPSVYLLSGQYPAVSWRKVPVGYVQYTAGWPDSASVPAGVRVAIKLLAAHYWGNREAYQEKTLTDLPMGFTALCQQFRTGLIGPIGQDHHQHQHHYYPWGAR